MFYKWFSHYGLEAVWSANVRKCSIYLEFAARRGWEEIIKSGTIKIYICVVGAMWSSAGFKTRRVELAREQVANVCCCCKTAGQQVWTATAIGELMFDAWKKFQNVEEHVRVRDIFNGCGGVWNLMDVCLSISASAAGGALEPWKWEKFNSICRKIRVLEK